MNYYHYRFICNRLRSWNVILIDRGKGYAYGSMATEISVQFGALLRTHSRQPHVVIQLADAFRYADNLDTHLVELSDSVPRWKTVMSAR